MNWATDLGVKRGAVVAVTTDWGKGVGDMVAYYAPRAGLTVSRQDVDKAHTVFAPQVAALKDARAEVVFLALNPDQAGNFVRAARAASYRPVILGTDNLTAGEFTSTAGSSAADVRYVLPPAAPGSAIRADVVRALRQKLRLPDSEEPHPFALYGYDTMWTLYRAMKAGKGNPERGAEFLESYRGEGATGPIQFTKAHDVVLAGSYRRMIIQKNASGKLAGVEVQ
jgi:ABC-type branched-subunit amino acid transport system substrate-binding protein